MRIGLLLTCAWLATACATQPQPPPPLMAPGQLESLPARPADYRIAYGQQPSQFGELRLPNRAGPHPVVVLVHGGCWKSEYATLRDLAALADALTDAGFATWSIEYRRLGEPGGGWPGTYRDVAAGIDHLRTLAAPHRLDLSRVAVLGHSAGGHLAHWSAARHRLPGTSPLHSADPLPLRGIINMAGRPDMASGIDAYEAMCRGPVIRDLLGGMPASVPERYRDSSPMALLPLGTPQILLWGDQEDFVPAAEVQAFAAAARRAGDPVELITIPATGHFETANPRSPAWRHVLGAVRRLLR